MSSTLPALSALKPSSLLHGGNVDAPSTLWERGTQYLNPWKIEFTEKIVDENPALGLQHVVIINVTGGVVSRQRDMLLALNDKFEPLFKQRFTPTSKSGKLNTVCSDHTRSFLYWEFRQSYSGMMPLNQIPPTTAIPGGSPYMFFKMAFGNAPVELAESFYTWEQAPGLVPSLSLNTWQLTRTGDVGEENLGLLGRLSRGAGFGEYPSRR